MGPKLGPWLGAIARWTMGGKRWGVGTRKDEGRESKIGNREKRDNKENEIAWSRTLVPSPPRPKDVYCYGYC